MNRYPRWKYILVALVVLIGLIYTIPNFYGESPAVQISPTKASLKADNALLAKVEASLKLAKGSLLILKRAVEYSRPIQVAESVGLSTAAQFTRLVTTAFCANTCTRSDFSPSGPFNCRF